MPTPPPLSLPDTSARLRHLAESWATTHINERGSFQTWLIRFKDSTARTRRPTI